MKVQILLNVLFLLTILPVKNRQLGVILDSRRSMLMNKYETELIKSQVGGEIFQLSYLNHNHERQEDITSGEETIEAHRYIIPLNFTSTDESDGTINIENITHVSNIHSKKLRRNNHIIGFLSEEKSIS